MTRAQGKTEQAALESVARKGFWIGRGKRAFDWALDAKVTSLAQVPPPYDIGADMNIWPCPAQ